MQNTHFILLCKKLNKSEWRDLLDFAASPYHNRREDVAQLLAYVCHYLPKIKGNHLEKELVWKKIFPAKPFDDAAMRYLIHLCYQLLQQFLIVQNIETDPIEQQIQLLEIFRKRKVDEKIADPLLKDISQTVENQIFRNFEYYEQTYSLNNERYERTIAQSRASSEGFYGLSDALNVSFVAQKLRQGCTVFSHKSFFQNNTPIDFLEEVLGFVAKNETMQTIPLVALYYHLYLSLSDVQDDKNFDKVKKILFESGHLFNHGERKEFYILAINCCIKRLNISKLNYIAEVFEIYRKGLETKALLDNDILSRFTYNNIVMAGVRLKEFAWTEQFIHEYKINLEKKHQDSTFHHSLATFYFKKQDFGKAMELLQRVEFDDVLHNLDARRMLLCIYYDLDEVMALETHLDAFKTYLYRQKNLGYHKDSCLNLIHFTRQLMNFDSLSKEKINALLAEIQDTTHLFEKEWLLEKYKI
jgi:hypothetical protein